MYQSELNMMKQAIIGLVNEVDYDFCFGCYNYGKIGDFKSVECLWCKEFICNECNNLYKYTISNKEHDVCESCYQQLRKNNSIILKLSERGKNTLTWDQLSQIFNNPVEVIDDMLEQISDELLTGEYYRYELNLLNFTEITGGIIYLFVKINMKDVPENDEIDTDEIDTDEINDVIEEINTYLAGSFDGFSYGHDEINSLYLNKSDKITMDIECM
jgi:hypothetical protein